MQNKTPVCITARAWTRRCSWTYGHPRTTRASFSTYRNSNRWRRRSSRACCLTMINRIRVYNSRWTSIRPRMVNRETSLTDSRIVTSPPVMIQTHQLAALAHKMVRMSTSRPSKAAKMAEVSEVSMAITICSQPVLTCQATVAVSTRVSYKVPVSTTEATQSMPSTTRSRCEAKSTWSGPRARSTHGSSPFASLASTMQQITVSRATMKHCFTILCTTLKEPRTRRQTI